MAAHWVMWHPTFWASVILTCTGFSRSPTWVAFRTVGRYQAPFQTHIPPWTCQWPHLDHYSIMPRRLHKPKNRICFLKRVLYSLIPCAKQNHILDDTPAGQQGNIPLPTTEVRVQEAPENGDLTASMVHTVSSSPCNGPCEGPCASSCQSSSFDTGLLRPTDSCDPDSESRTLGSEASLKSPNDGLPLESDPPKPEGGSFFYKAKDFHVNQFVVNEAPKNPRAAMDRLTDARAINIINGWTKLFEWVAPSAFFDSSEGTKTPSCDRGTRIEVIAEIMSWLDDSESLQSLLCITGSSGAGKSALQQTIAAQCEKRKVPFATFLFSKNDPSRDNTSLVIPTIAFQLGLRDSALGNLLAARVGHDPFTITKCLQSQLMDLIVEPVNSLKSDASATYQKVPYIILIDNFNECLDENSQEELLRAIKGCILDANRHRFRIIISSRIGQAMQAIIEGWPTQIYHIPLTMDPTVTDPRRMSWRRLQTNKGGGASRRATLLPGDISTSSNERLPGSRQEKLDISRRSRQHRPAGLDLRRESSARMARRSRSVPPVKHFTPICVYHPPTAPVATPQEFLKATPTLSPHSLPLIYLPVHATPEATEALSYLRRELDQEPEPDSAATDLTNQLYPPSPYGAESPDKSESPDSESPVTASSGTPIHINRAQAHSIGNIAPPSRDIWARSPANNPDFRVAQPQPIRLLANEGPSPRYTPKVFTLPTWLRNSPQSLEGPHTRSPSPIFLGDPRRTFLANIGTTRSANDTAIGRNSKRRRLTLQQDLFSPPFPGSPDSERITTSDVFLRVRKRQKTAAERHDQHGTSLEYLEID